MVGFLAEAVLVVAVVLLDMTVSSRGEGLLSMLLMYACERAREENVNDAH